MSNVKTLYTFNVLYWVRYMTIEMFGFVPAIVVPLPVTRVTLQEMVANTTSQFFGNDESPVLILNPATASASCDNSSPSSSKPCYSDIYITPYDQTYSSTLTSSSSLLSCEAEYEYCEDKDEEKGKKENDMRMSADTSSGITVLHSRENSASDTVEDEHEQRNTAPCTDTLDVDIPISEEELAAYTHSFTPQSSSTSPPPLSISLMQIPSGRSQNPAPDHHHSLFSLRDKKMKKETLFLALTPWIIIC